MKELQAWAYQHVGNTAAEDELWDIVGRMIAAEREACACVAEDCAVDVPPETSKKICTNMRLGISAAIRARGEE